MTAVSPHIALARAAGNNADPALLAELRFLRDRNAALEDMLGRKQAALFPVRLRHSARALFALLLARDGATVEQFITTLYAGRPEADWPLDPPRTIRVQLSYIRRKIASAGGPLLPLECHRAPADATLYRLTPAAKAWAQRLIVQRPARAAA
jgi:hypothetical protein